MSLKLIVNFVAVGVCAPCKLPQIQKCLRVKSTTGLSLPALVLELAAYSFSISYFLSEGYSLTDCFEYPCLVVSNCFLIAYILRARNVSLGLIIAFIAFYSTILYCFVGGIVPKYVLPIALSFNIPIAIVSKLAQVFEIVKTKRGDTVSQATWAMLAVANAARFYTVVVETADKILLTNFGVSMTLNALVAVTAAMYSSGVSKKAD